MSADSPSATPASAAAAGGRAAIPVVCPVCSHRNPTGAKYCNNCGSRVHLRECVQCEAINEPGVAHCYKCGAPMTPRALDQRDVPAEVSRLAPRGAPAGLQRRPAGDAPAPAKPQSTIATAYSPSLASVAGVAPARLAVPVIAQDDDNPLETPVHFIGDAEVGFDAADAEAGPAPADSSRRARRARGHARRSAAIIVGLLLLCVAAGLAGLAHYRPDVIDGALAWVRSTMAKSSGAMPEAVPAIPTSPLAPASPPAPALPPAPPAPALSPAPAPPPAT
ncbi:MAG: zinc ribbon domain-containing protein [Betaproteobacteria bacterium]